MTPGDYMGAGILLSAWTCASAKLLNPLPTDVLRDKPTLTFASSGLVPPHPHLKY